MCGAASDAEGPGAAPLSVDGDDILLEYGNGTTIPLEGGLMAFRDEWSFSGGTGRFENVTGSGIGYWEYDPTDLMNPDPASRLRYRMSGTIDYDAAEGEQAVDFRATLQFEMTFPYVVKGTPTEDPCWQDNPDQQTTVMRQERTATHLGPFTTYAELCYD